MHDFGLEKPSVLIVENATYVAQTYADLLAESCSVALSTSEEDLDAVINQGTRYDLVIIGMLFPPEGSPYDWHTSPGTMLRMLEIGISDVFYVITLEDIQSVEYEVQRMHDGGLLVDFICEDETEFEEENFLQNVEELLRKAAQRRENPILLSRLEYDIDIIYSHATDLDSLSNTDKSQISRSLKSICKALVRSGYLDCGKDIEGVFNLLVNKYRPKVEALEADIDEATHTIQEWLQRNFW